MQQLLSKIVLNPKECQQFLKLAKQPRILNCSVTRPIFDKEKDENFNKERIPQASFFDIDKIADKSTKLPHMLPSEQEFRQHMALLDVTQDDDILLYDDFSVCGSSRVWWTFKVFGKQTVILNGNLKDWQNEGLDIETGDISYTHRMLQQDVYEKFEKNSNFVADFDQIVEFSKLIGSTKQGLILDARNQGRFSGEQSEPRKEIPSGHIPNSQCVFFKQFLTDDWKFKSVEEIKQIYKSKNINLDQEIFTTCGSGVTASVLYLTLELIGKKQGKRVYDGSWCEYSTITNNITLQFIFINNLWKLSKKFMKVKAYLYYQWFFKQKNNMNEELSQEASEVINAAIESNLKTNEENQTYCDIERAVKIIKESMDKKFGPTWHCIIGEGMSFDVNYQEGSLMYCYANANLAILLFKSQLIYSKDINNLYFYLFVLEFIQNFLLILLSILQKVIYQISLIYLISLYYHIQNFQSKLILFYYQFIRFIFQYHMIYYYHQFFLFHFFIL